MKKIILSALRIAVPLMLGIFVIWYFYQQLNPDEKTHLYAAFLKADYSWIWLSLVFGLLSHISRAYRWKFLLDPLGIPTRFNVRFFSVMIGYLLNLAFPRAGEPARAVYISRYDGIPFEKGFGTIFAERIIDICILACICGTTLLLQTDKLDEFVSIANKISKHADNTGQTNYLFIALLIGLLALLIAIAILYIARPIFKSKVRKIFLGFLEGLKTIFTMPKKWYFLAHSLFIWLMYLCMYVICYNALPETSDIPLSNELAGFVAGSIGIIVIQGGIGIYPVLVAIATTLYLGLPENSLLPFNNDGYALGWIIWASQTILIIVVGGVSLAVIPRIKKVKHGTIDHSK